MDGQEEYVSDDGEQQFVNSSDEEQEEYLDEDFLSEQMAEPKRKKKKIAAKPVQLKSTSTGQYELSFNKFLEQRNHQQFPNVQESNDNTICPPQHPTISKTVPNCSRSVNSPVQSNRKSPSTAPKQVAKLPIKSPITSSGNVKTPDPTSTGKSDEFDGMTDRELLIMSIRATRQVNRKVDRVIKYRQLDTTRWTRIEQTLSMHFPETAEKLSWPIAGLDALYGLEEQLKQQKAGILKALQDRFKKGNRVSVFEFIHSNLIGLLGGSGKWSWTGRIPGYTPPSKASHEIGELLEPAHMDSAGSSDDSAPSNLNRSTGASPLMERSNPASTLLSVQVLRDVCHNVFECSDDDVLSCIRRSLANMNSALRKRNERTAKLNKEA